MKRFNKSVNTTIIVRRKKLTKTKTKTRNLLDVVGCQKT